MVVDPAPPQDSAFDAEVGHAFAAALPELCVPWSAARPDAPSLVTLNADLARELGWEPDRLGGAHGVRFLLGNALGWGSRPVAQAYAGHQFGGYARLGDGRALLLGEVRDRAGRLRDLHLKGSGRTPFARADGFAALGPMLRELLMGEAMHALGIPTTRALAVVATGRRVARDGELKPGAVLVRTAASHLRVGTFQLARSSGDTDLLRRLTDFAIDRHVPDAPPDGGDASRARALLASVIDAQARLVAAWMLVGFVHGVMNTDNVTISGETIDYGPCAYIEATDPAAVFSSIDHGGRYAYGNQPGIALWNLTRFAESLLPLLGDDPEAAASVAQDALEAFEPAYRAAWRDGMRAKLGLPEAVDADTVTRLADALLEDFRAHRVDYTAGMRALAGEAAGAGALRSWYPTGVEPGAWLADWLALRPDPARIRAASPALIARNHLVDAALNAAEAGDLAPLERLGEALSEPFAERPGFEAYAQPAPAGVRHVTYCGT